MNVNSYQPTKFSVEGILFQYNGNLSKKQRFHIYDENKQYLAYGKTDGEGHFKVDVKAPAPLDKKITLIFRSCYDVKLVNSHEKLKNDQSLCANFSFYRGRRETAEVKESFCLKEYDSRKFINLGEVHLEKPYENEQVPLRYTADIAKAVIPAKITSFIENTKEKLDIFNQHDIKDVIKAYKVESTPLKAENTWKMLTNGICPIYMKEEDNFYVAEVNWDRYEFDKTKSLPNVKAYFQKQGDKDPILKGIEVQFRETLHPSSKEEDKTKVITYLAEDRDTFEEGLRIANSAFHVFGQTVFHLAIGHVYGANAANAAYDYLVGHPIGDILLPHCQFIRKISQELGGPIIFEEDGVLNISALSVKGIALLISDALKSLDPFSFTPRTPINDNHVFAKVQQHHHNLLSIVVSVYIDQHWEKIKADWKPVHGFFRTMFKRSPIYRPWEGENYEKAKWRDKNEIGGNGKDLPPREKYKEFDEDVRSFRHIAKNVEGPEGSDRQMIKDFIVDFIHRVTLWHSWIHRSQYVTTKNSPNVSDINFAPLSLENYGKGDYGGMKIEEAIHQLEVISIFNNFDVTKYSLVEGKDVHPDITHLVKTMADKYFNNGINPYNEIQVSTVI